MSRALTLTIVNVLCLLMWTDYGFRMSQPCNCDISSNDKSDTALQQTAPDPPPPVAVEAADRVEDEQYEVEQRRPPQSIFSIESDEREFTKLAHYCTDKTSVHRYQHLYPTVLHRFRHAADAARANGLPPPKFRLLEMGLGCNMEFCVAGGMRLFRSYLPSNVEYHAFEFNMNLCRSRFNISRMTREHIDYVESHVCEGSSADSEALQKCGERFGPFDIIVDDASHQLNHIYAAYNFWFPSHFLRPGGVYIIEDLQTQFDSLYLNHQSTEESMATHISDIMRWKLNLNPNTGAWAGALRPMSLNPRAQYLAWLTKSVMCASEVCAFEKMSSLDTYPRGFPERWRLPSTSF